MLTNKTKTDFIKFINKTLGKTAPDSPEPKKKNSFLDINNLKNSIMKTLQTSKVSTMRLGKFLKLLPKKTVVNVPGLITAFFELEKEGWITIETANFVRTITNSGQEWVPLPTKKTAGSFDIDLALMGVYDDTLAVDANPLINEKVCLNEGQLEKTIKNLNEKQLAVIEHLNVWQNFFLNEFLKIFLTEKAKTVEEHILDKIKDLAEYNERILHFKLKQADHTIAVQNLTNQQISQLIDDYLAGDDKFELEFAELNRKTQQKISRQFQEKIHQQGIDAIVGKIIINHAHLLTFLKD